MLELGCLNDVGIEMIKLGQNRVRSGWTCCVDWRINVNPVILLLIRDDYEHKEGRINRVLDIVKWEEGARGGD